MGHQGNNLIYIYRERDTVCDSLSSLEEGIKAGPVLSQLLSNGEGVRAVHLGHGYLEIRASGASLSLYLKPGRRALWCPRDNEIVLVVRGCIMYTTWRRREKALYSGTYTSA